MKPLPAQNTPEPASSGSEIPNLPVALAGVAPAYSSANRRAPTPPAQVASLWLLVASTGLAGVFCWMYITKPVITTTAEMPREARSEEISVPSEVVDPVEKASILPATDRLPGESTPLASSPAPLALPANPFEQTNIRVQHILTAEAPGGPLAKIDLDVPVLYQSRALRWTPAEVADARDLLARLTAYQAKSRTLRDEGAELLAAWNQLVERSIPASQLRADSPTLPANQQDAAATPRPALLDTTGSIQIKTVGK